MGIVWILPAPRHLFPGLSENQYKIKLLKNMLRNSPNENRDLCLEKIKDYK